MWVTTSQKAEADQKAEAGLVAEAFQADPRDAVAPAVEAFQVAAPHIAANQLEAFQAAPRMDHSRRQAMPMVDQMDRCSQAAPAAVGRLGSERSAASEVPVAERVASEPVLA